MPSDAERFDERFPRAACYHPEWLQAAVSGAANPLWLTEWLASAMELRPGMKVLDLGCGRAASSIFLHREFGLQVWATDLWFDPAENWQRIRAAGAADGVFPIRADAHALPFAAGFFDAIVCIDSFSYYGTDDLYLNYLAQFVTPGGLLGVAGAGLIQDITEQIPEHLMKWWTHDLWCLHSAEWWRRHWQRTGIVHVETADTMPDGWRLWLNWISTIAPDNETEIKALTADAGKYLGYIRVVGRRQVDTTLQPRIDSIPAQYTPKPLLREQMSEEQGSPEC